ncbi:MAG: hypothetical protein AB7F86_00560 [Bdellovibrionales bacterium]
MSRHTTVGALTLFVAVAAITMAGRHADEANHSSITASTTITPKKELSKKELLAASMKRGPAMKHTSKIRGPLQSAIELAGAPPEKSGDVFVLVGRVTSSQELSNVKFQWALPDTVELVNGTLNGEISILGPEQPHDLQITVRALNLSNHQIHLVTDGSLDGTVFADSAQYNSSHEPALNAAKKPQLKAQSLGDEGLKIQPKLRVFH